MKLFTIKSTNEKTLYKGYYKTAKDCIEAAIKASINLDDANLKHLNLSNINLDTISLRNANFTGCNLTGANLSEANLSGSNFTSCDLYNTCFAESNLQNCNFTNATFGATNISDANISRSKFTTLSCFSLEFIQTKRMNNCEFTTISNITIPFSKPPIVIHGETPQPLIFFENTTLRGHEILNSKNFIKILKTGIFTTPVNEKQSITIN